MTVDYEPAPRPAPLWLLPLTIAVLALALLWAAQQFADRDVSGFGGQAQPNTPQPTALVDGSAVGEVPEALTRRFGDDVVLARRLDTVPDEVDASCLRGYADADDPARRRLTELIESSEVSAAHLGPDALTYLRIAVADAPPGYPREVEIACVATSVADGWRSPARPHLDFALSGRPGATLRGTQRPPPSGGRYPDVRTRLVQVPVGARWAVQPRGGWWLAYEVGETSWVLMTLNEFVGDDDPLRVVFADSSGDVVAERGVGPTRSAAQADHSADFELVAGDVREILDKLEDDPVRVCEPGNRSLCVWLALDDLGEVQAYAAFGPHPLDTPPMGHVGYCPAAAELQGSVTPARFGTDGLWLSGPVSRGLDQYAVRFEAGMVVVDLSEHVTGEPATGEPVERAETCVFAGTRPRGKAIE